MARTPGTPASKIERIPVYTPGGSRVKEEKIFVTVRVRPLNDAKDEQVWECNDNQTIQYRGDTTASYTFDRVFGPTSLTETVYEEGAKATALSALTGINATIFAYGQTGSGKTFTMRGVTESAVSDIYNHIRNTPEREFTIKISAMEIYNENVKDLLMPESGPLRLMDDPEKGTIVEKLEEQIAKDSQHLRELISKCEAQRQVGETGSNKRSSRSHQIIRLTVESRLRENSGCVKSFVAVLNFVDLAGSERVAQTHAKGKTLEEGCHINKSLLTLTTVIRKLSENKSGHIPYRDSKLTRILQLSLGGNARTAIICTMSPSKSNMELSRNTLFFAMSAKKVTNTAQVNMVISDKQLVRHLQKEVARLEAELRTPEPTNSDAVLMEKDRRIRQMEEEMEKLKKERDLAKSQLDELRKKIGDENQQGWNPFDSSPRRVAKCLTFSFSGQSQRNMQPLRQSSTAPVMLVQEIRKLEQLQQQLGDEANRALEVLQKEVACHRLGNQDAAETIAKLQAEIRDMRSAKPSAENKDVSSSETGPGSQTNLKEEITRLHSQGNTIANLEVQLENVQRSIDRLVMSLPTIASQMGPCSGVNMEKTGTTTPSSKSQSGKKKKALPLALSGSMNRPHLLRAPCSPLSSSRNAVVSPTNESDENRAPQPENEHNSNNNNDNTNTNTPTKSEPTPTKSESNTGTPAISGGDASSREGTPGSGYRRSSSVNMRKMQKMFQNAAEENVRSIRAYVTELKERVAKLQYQKQLLVCQVLELEANEAANAEDSGTENISAVQSSPNSWRNTFREQMQQIFMLWHECYVSIIHRTQFYLLFRGDPADQIYIEVEVRRLMWLHQHFSEGGDASPAQICGDEPSISISSSIRELKNEREFLAKRMNSRLTEEEKERLFLKWNVPLDGKQRKLQLINKLWTDPTDRVHIDESADIVARLVGFCERDGNVAKEMFELNFALPSSKKPWLLGWQPISNLLRL
ncbi:ATP binding microtubule motor family protein [Rhynchospora pubera]|uniref:ATP binding microtubule motor family protein n=1 Tax=Rhynchospora pubera TaxID=906938 RepID=A0AAV8GF09_9POAL|nr:ATP binding microtubule motor family protein [Rhynchospora pubera]